MKTRVGLVQVISELMADLVKLTIDGQAGAGRAGHAGDRRGRKQRASRSRRSAITKGSALQAACRMCLVEVEKMPKLMTAARCRWPKAWWCAPRLRRWRQARKSTLEFLLTNHPLDCPVCDKGGECELQDMVFRYGAGESRFTEEQATTSTRSSGRRWCSSTRRAASSASAACASATKAWASARWASSIAASFPRSRPITAIIWSATSAARASTSARSAR